MAVPSKRPITFWSAVLLALVLPITTASAQQTTTTTVGQTFENLAARAAAAREADRVEEATSLYRRALALRPRWAEGWFYLGTLHYDRNQFAPAARAFRKVIALQPRSGTALAMLGLSEFQLGLDNASLEHLTAAKDIGVTDNPDLKHAILFDEALLLQRSGRFESAQEALEALCQENVQREDAVAVFGMVQLRLRTTDRLATTPPAPQIFPRLGHAGCL
ncbi:MAG TPA: tetratricopeptide repeat protein, partial [Terriglobales bacterium]